MKKTIAVNAITLLRIPLTILFYITLFSDCNQVVVCSIVFLLIVGTDFFDGKFARKYNAETKIGATLDVSTDFFYVITASYALYKQELYPFWMLMIIVGKFIEFLITSNLALKEEKKGRSFFFDKIGKFVALALYGIPIFIIVMHPLVSEVVFANVRDLIFTSIGILAFASTFQRIRTIA